MYVSVESPANVALVSTIAVNMAVGLAQLHKKRVLLIDADLWTGDIAVLMKLIPDINRAFGLTPEQVERLAPDRRLAVYKAISAGGSLLAGKLVTRDLIVHALRAVGVRLTTQQAAKFVPIAGQAVSAALTYSSLRYVCEQHIQQCVAISRQLMLPAPTTADESR